MLTSTHFPAKTSLLLIPFSICVLSATTFTLKPETLSAWNDYVKTADAGTLKRAAKGGNFLWTFEDASRAAQVKQGQYVVAPGSAPAPYSVEGGLIHHYVGAAFLPGRTLDHFLSVMGSYDRYPQMYKPYVVNAKLLERREEGDRYSLVMATKKFLFANALEADYSAKSVRLDENRFYSLTESTRVQEIVGFGTPEEKRLPEGVGGGYIWKLHSIVRIEQRDGGLYVELEALALTRDIPSGLRFLITPTVRRMGRNSVITSLEQTAAGVGISTKEPTEITSTKQPVHPGKAPELTGAIAVPQRGKPAHGTDQPPN